MTALERLARALAAYLASTPTLEQESPEAAHLARAVEEVLALADDRALVELPPPPSLDDEALVAAYARASVADPGREGVDPVDAAVAQLLTDGVFARQEARRHLRNVERALRELVRAHAQQLRDLHAGALPREGSGLDQYRREVAEGSGQLAGFTLGLLHAGHVALRAAEPAEG